VLAYSYSVVCVATLACGVLDLVGELGVDLQGKRCLLEVLVA
jgi:hypothetical protein